jgi:hypothetical protein
MEDIVKCECCGCLYDYCTEPKEVQEGDTHICSDCWTIEEATI